MTNASCNASLSRGPRIQARLGPGTAQSTESVVTGGTEVPADIDVHTTAGKLADLKRRVAAVAHAGSERAVEKQHARGKKTARERIAMLLDEGSFIEMDKYARHRSNAFGQEKNRPYGDGVVTGYGTVDGRTVAVFAQDFTVFGGSLGEVFGEKICKVMDFAMKIGCPVIGLNDSGGARIQEGVVSLGLYGEIFRRNVHASGVIPQISLIMGPAPAVRSTPAHRLHGHGGPDLAHVHHRPRRHQDGHRRGQLAEDLGGARAHNTKSGVAHYMGSDEEDAIDYVKALLSYLPSNNLEEPPSYDLENDLAVTDEDRWLDALIPDSPNQPYDMHTVRHVLDDGEFLEVQPLFAPNIVCGLGRIEGRSVGVVANQPMQFAGTLDIDASEKAARFVRTCDAFNIPVLTFVDVPGFLPGTDQEWDGIIRRGASSSTPTRRRRCRSSRSSPARPTVAPTTSWAPSTSGPTSTSPRRRRRSRSWARRARSTSSTARSPRPPSAARTSTRHGSGSSPSTRTPSPTPTSRPSAATSTP